MNVALIPLLPDEARDVLAGRRSGLSTDEAALVRLVAKGMTLERVGRALGISSRAVSRRLARLRDQFGAETNVELVARLARGGF